MASKLFWYVAGSLLEGGRRAAYNFFDAELEEREAAAAMNSKDVNPTLCDGLSCLVGFIIVFLFCNCMFRRITKICRFVVLALKYDQAK